MPVLRLHRALPLLSVVVAISACSSSPAAPPAAGNPPPASAQPVPDGARQLQSYHWHLRAAFDARGQATTGSWRLPNQAPVQLNFKDGRLSVSQLCNTMGAGYTLNGAAIKIERPVSTMMACGEPGLMALEKRVASQLPLINGYTIEGRGQPVLSLRFADGGRWEFIGQATAETRYGSAGEVVFMEVASQKVPCNNPLMRDATCLKVRDLRYDPSGREEVTSDWRVMQGNIDGYRFVEGTRNVLRLKRYSMARNGQLPADAPSHAYVLDMMVESARER